MPKIVVEIEWDWPEDENWLNADNIALALHSYCGSTRFRVQPVPDIEFSTLESTRWWGYNLAFRLVGNTRIWPRLGWFLW